MIVEINKMPPTNPGDVSLGPETEDMLRSLGTYPGCDSEKDCIEHLYRFELLENLGYAAGVTILKAVDGKPEDAYLHLDLINSKVMGIVEDPYFWAFPNGTEAAISTARQQQEGVLA